MSDRVEDLIREIEALLGKNDEEQSSEQTEQSEQNQNVAYQQTNYEATEQEQDEYQQVYQKQYWENWKNLGRSVFMGRYAYVPNIGKYMPFIEQRAELKFQIDYAQGRVKDSYDKYLEEAFKEVREELGAISKDYVDISKSFIIQENLAKQVAEKPYTIKDYRNDYKKMLEYITYKGVADIYYKDGSEKGKYGEPKLRLGESIDTIDV
jgi:ethanolamine ammonia-lyase small subunit